MTDRQIHAVCNALEFGDGGGAMKDWEARLKNELGMAAGSPPELTGLIALASEAAREASYWQAVAEGKDALIMELRARMMDKLDPALAALSLARALRESGCELESISVKPGNTEVDL